MNDLRRLPILFALLLVVSSSPPRCNSAESTSPGQISNEELIERCVYVPDFYEDLCFADLVHAFEFKSISPDNYELTHSIAQRMVDLGSSNAQMASRGYARLAAVELNCGKWSPEWETWLQKAGTLAGTGVTLARGEFLMIRGFLRAKFQHEMEAGIDDLMEAIWIGNQLESNELLALSYTRASIVMLFMEVERRSWEFALRGLHFAKLTERDQYLHYSLTVLHNHMLAMEQPEEATKYEKKLLTVKKRLHLLVGKTGFASRSKSREKHLKQLQHYVSLAENSEDTAELAEVTWQLGVLLYELDRYPEALVKLLRSRGIFVERQDPDGIAGIDSFIGLCMLKNDQQEEGLKHLNSAIETYTTMHHYEAPLQYCLNVSDIFAKQGNIPLAYEWSTKAHEIREDNLPREMAREIEMMTELFVRQDNLSRERTSQMRLQKVKLDRSKLVSIFAMVASSVLAIGFWLWTNHRARGQLEAQVRLQTKSLEQSKQHAESADAAKTRFLAHLNHELRNPLHAVLANSELLQQHHSETKIGRESLAGLSVSAKHLCNIVGNILDLSRVESGETPVEESTFNLRKIFEDVFQVLQPLAEANSLRVTLRIPESSIVLLTGDAGKLRQILINLGSNGIKFSDHGQVSFQVGTEKKADRVWVTIDVEDAGSGIPPAEQESIFQPFFRSPDRDTNTKGTGVGLPLARSFAELMGGQLVLRHSDESGSCFRLELPFGESSTADVDADQPVAHSHRRILLIDDDPEVRRVVELLGKSLGHDVISANQTEQIMRLVSEESFDSVLLDLQMPNQDGFDVAQQICALDLAHQPKIVAITGNALQSVREKALDKGFDEFLAKPFGLHSLADVI